MLNPFKLFNRLACLAVLLFGSSTAVMVAIVVLATGGLGSGDLVSIPGAKDQIEQLGPPDVTLNDVVDKRPLMHSVPLPDEVSGDTDVIVTNLSLAILLALLFGVVSTVLSNLIREEEDTFRRWLSIPILKQVMGLLGWGAGQNVRRGCLTLPIIVAIFALYGLIFAFLEDGIDLLTPEGMQLALVMAMSVGLISLAGDVARRRVAFFWRRTARFGLYPANLLIAVGTTAFSRVVHLSPGIVFGTPGGADIDMDGQPRFREVTLALVTLVVMIGLGAAGWAAAAAIRAAGDRTMSVNQADFAGPLAQLGLTIGLALFLVAVETSFFEMVPIGATLGGEMFRWNPVIWFVAFTPVTFAFAHTLLNPGSDYLDAFEQANVQVLSAVIGVLTLITATLWFYFHVLRPKPSRAPVPPPPFTPQPPPPSYRQPSPGQPIPPPSFTPQPPAPPVIQPPRDKPSSSGRNEYVPPPILISDDVPPPIVIEDKNVPPARGAQRTEQHSGPGPSQAETFSRPAPGGPTRIGGQMADMDDDEDTVLLDDEP
ncbi:MAG: hypothetical protein JXJ20_15685 [Anaerolineae bacterium]|nr:hypothetical protein [Anaerolineae bacterium]